MTVCFESAVALTSKELRTAFLADQREMSHMWKKAFDDLLVNISTCFSNVICC